MGQCQIKYGNLCIAAHNYKNETFFSNISKLENGDIIDIYNNNKNVKHYKVYDIYRVEPNDLSCINQDTNGLRIITLITCDTANDKFRTVVKAEEIK